MSKLPNCPQCNSEYAYEDRNMYICTECGHEWSAVENAEDKINEENKDKINAEKEQNKPYKNIYARIYYTMKY